MGDRAAAELRQDVHVIRDGHLVGRARRVLPPGHRDLGHRGHSLRGAEPAHHRLVPDPHVEDIVPAQRSVVPPVERGVRLHEAARRGLQLDRQHLTQEALGEQRLDGGVELQGVGRGHELGDQARGLAGSLEHAPALGGVHGHARLAEHVLARAERGGRHLAVHVGPGADAHRVDVGRVDDLLPARVHPADAELARHPLARFLRPVGDRDQLDPGLGLQLGDVVLARVGAGADEADADLGVGHDFSPACWRQVSSSSRAARVNAHMLASRSLRPVSSVRAASTAPATAKHECPAASP